ncbi:hypothetical protein D3C72_2139120 [compost metagenome]
MADGNAATVHIQSVRIDTKAIATVNDLARERFIQFPQTDIANLQPMPLQEFRDGRDGPDTHFLGRTARDRDTAVDAKRLQSTTLSQPAVHQDGG